MGQDSLSKQKGVKSKNTATRLLKAAVKSVLSGAGFVSNKSGRSWYQDNGWFISIIEFQAPRGWQGSFLNVAASFLWTPSLTGEVWCSFDYGGRIGHNKSNDGTTLEYTGNDEDFSRLCEALARRALQESEKFEQLRDWATAKQVLLPYKFTSDELWGNWHRAMLCFLTGDSRAAKYLEAFSSFDFDRWPNEEVRRFASEQSAFFLPLVDDFPAAQERISEVIRTNRQALRNHGYPALDPDWSFKAPPRGSVPELPVGFENSKRNWIQRLFDRKDKR